MLKVPVFLMTDNPHEPIEREGVTYNSVVDDIARAVELAKRDAGEGWVSLLGGSISRQCLRLGLVDEIHLDVAPVLLGEGISLFAGLANASNCNAPRPRPSPANRTTSIECCGRWRSVRT